MPPKIVTKYRSRGVSKQRFDETVSRLRKRAYDLKVKVDTKPIESSIFISAGAAIAGFVGLQDYSKIGPIETSALLGLGLVGYGGWIAKKSDVTRSYAIHLGQGLLAANVYEMTVSSIQKSRAEAGE